MNLTPQTNCQYGAPMGRQSWNDNGKPFQGRFYLRHIRLNQGGYDSGGAYWGTGQRLYGFAAADDSVNGFIRAYDREDAKTQVLYKHPGANFFGDKPKVPEPEPSNHFNYCDCGDYCGWCRPDLCWGGSFPK